ncbi:beta-ketoacyl-[acyl-carrier-protein] synthase family protein [Streptomyces sp. NPDC048002]|uniref:beta-ketoacyl-[acyl-carrier-protein] synthase family protein n=1 Tax=Streptomyces sp. NPDC048002 TaxID=3154344 RepID=UPI0033F200FD
MTRRAVITGLGVVAPGGIGTKDYWALLTGGRAATRHITFFDASGYRSRVAAEVDFDPAAAGLGLREIHRMDRSAQFAVVSAWEAVADSGLALGGLDPLRTGVSIGSAVGAATSLDAAYPLLSDEGREWRTDTTYAVPQLYDYMVPSALAREVAWTVAAQGPVALVSTGCTSGLDAIGHAAGIIAEGSADIMLAGAAEAPVCAITAASFDAIKATTPYEGDDPSEACRPFDLHRDGFVLGEGGAVLVLEEKEHARRRGAHVYAEIAGFATRGNAYHMTGLRSDGTELAAAVAAALDEARLPVDAVDYVNAHGSGTRQNDVHETAALKKALGTHAHDVPVSSIKSMIGHSLGAIGSLEAAACALALEHGAVPPTANLHTPDPECDLDYVPLTARAQPLDTVLSVGSGFGGLQSALVLRKPA